MKFDALTNFQGIGAPVAAHRHFFREERFNLAVVGNGSERLSVALLYRNAAGMPVRVRRVETERGIAKFPAHCSVGRKARQSRGGKRRKKQRAAVKRKSIAHD